MLEIYQQKKKSILFPLLQLPNRWHFDGNCLRPPKAIYSCNLEHLIFVFFAVENDTEQKSDQK
jgi:hypothetical protein